MTDHQPPGWQTVVPRIITADPHGLVTFVKAVFDADGDFQATRPTELRIGDSVLMISDGAERQPMPAFLYVYVADTDAAFERAVRSGATVVEEPAEMPYGDRRAMVEDGWGARLADRDAPRLRMRPVSRASRP